MSLHDLSAVLKEPHPNPFQRPDREIAGWFLAPDGAALKAGSGGKALKVDQSISGGLLRVTFEGQPGAVSWSVR